MIGKLKSFFDTLSGEAEGQNHSFEERQLAAAALLVEAATMDGDFADDERAAILDLLSDRFGLEKEEAEELLKEAEAHQEGSTQLIRYTRAIKDHFSEEERISLMEMLWEVVYADGRLDHYEDNLMRRIGGLIYVSERDRGEARKRVLARLGHES